MNIFFSDKFENALINNFGETYRLGKYRFGLYNGNTIDNNYSSFIVGTNTTILPDLYSFESLWYSEEESGGSNNVLSMNITPTTIPQGSNGESYIVVVYYSDFNDNIVDIAFILTPSTVYTSGEGEVITGSLNLCLNGSNYINIKFPEWVSANILTKSTNDDINYVESSSNNVGINTFLAREGVYNDSDLLSKDSYYKYTQQFLSNNNQYPLYLDEKGEKIYSISVYKHYKKINIKSTGSKFLFYPETGAYDYYVGGGNGVSVLGECVYDQYKVVNGTYELEKENVVENLGNTTLRQSDTSSNIISATDNYTLDQVTKGIYFNEDITQDTTNFIATLSFKSEIGDTAGSSVLIKSNLVRFITYQNWSVEYASDLFQLDETGKSHVVLLFDNYEESEGWSYGEGTTGESGYITISSKSEIDLDNIEIINGDNNKYSALFSRYFTVTKSSNGYDETSKTYKYSINIITNKATYNNNDNGYWYPLDENGNSILILNTINIVGSNNPTDDVKFYCVQRVITPVSIGCYRSGSWNNTQFNYFEGTLGLKTISNLYVINPIGTDYCTWEASYDDGDSTNVLIDSTYNNIVSPNTIPSLDNSISVYTGASCSSSTVSLSSITFKRLNKYNSYDPTNWKDLIYCHPDNDHTVYFFIDKDISSTDSWKVTSNTKYFYTNTSSSKRLYLFDRDDQTSQEFTVVTKIPISSSNTFTISYGDESFSSFFTTSVSTTTANDAGGQNKILTGRVTITPKTLDTSTYSIYNWYPSVLNGATSKYDPISVTVSDGTRNETFYCIIKPNLDDTIKFFNSDTISETSNIKYMNSDEMINGVRTKSVYISTTDIESEFNNWFLCSKDPEVYMSTTLDNSGLLGTTLLNESLKSTWNTSGSVRAILTTKSLPTNTKDFSLTDLVIGRCVGKYSNLLNYYSDWKNQLCSSHRFHLGIDMEGISPSTSIDVYTDNDNSELVKLGDEIPLELDHIGLYKLFIKTSSRFRIIIGPYNEQDNFYFYNISSNSLKTDILSEDIGDFDAISGKEICFAYLGDEINAFSVLDQKLRTSIRIVNLDDNSSIYIPLHRKYFGRITPQDSFADPAIDTNLVMIGSTSNNQRPEIFLRDSDLGIYTVNYKSNLETSVYYISKNQYSVPYKCDFGVVLNYNTYNTKSSVVRDDVTTQIRSRGYSYSYSGFSIRMLVSPDKVYPISVIGTFQIMNPNNFNKEKLSYYVYKLLPAPTVVFNKTSVSISYLAQKFSTILISKTTGSELTLDFCITGSTTYTVVSADSVMSSDGKFIIRRDSARDTTIQIAYSIYDNTRTDYLGESNVTLGTLRATVDVPCNNFIKDINGNIIIDQYYSQEKVNSIVGTNSVSIPIIRLSKEKSETFISGSTEIIKKEGEIRNYTLNIPNDADTVDAAYSLSTQTGFIKSINLVSGSSVDINYKSKLERHGYTTTGISLVYSWSNGLVQNVIDNLYDNYSGTYESDNFSLRIGNSDIQFTGLVQEKWSYGIMIGNNLYLGKNNEVTLDYPSDTDTTTLFVSCVKLPTTKDTTDTINSGFIIATEFPSAIVDSHITKHIKGNTALTDYNTGFGYPVSIGLPINSSSSDVLGPYSIVYSDTYGNEVTVKITIQPRRDFSLTLFKGYYTDAKSNIYVSTDLEVNEGIAFSSSSSLSYPAKLYLLTDAPDSVCSSGFYIKSYLTRMYGTTPDNNDLARLIDYYMDESISASLVSECGPEELSKLGTGISVSNSTGYRLYQINLSSRVKKYRFYDTSTPVNLSNYMGSTPYIGSTNIGFVAAAGYTRVESRYGACILQLSNPYKSYLGCQLWEKVGEATEYTSTYKVSHPVDYNTTEAETESQKYPQNGSYFTSNTKNYSTNGESYSWYYMTGNKLYISYKDDSNYKYNKPISQPEVLSSAFPRFGYYCGFLFTNVKLAEWYNDGVAWGVTNFTNYRYYDGSISGLVMALKTGDSGDMISTTIYRDEMEPTANVDRTVSGNPETISIPKYYSSGVTNVPVNGETISTGNGYVNVSSNSGSPYKAGIIFTIPMDQFNTVSGSEIYTTTKTIRVSGVGDTHIPTSQDVVFTFDIVINLNKS